MVSLISQIQIQAISGPAGLKNILVSTSTPDAATTLLKMLKQLVVILIAATEGRRISLGARS